MRLAGRVAVITGAGMGIGRATALLFAGEGARVVVADFDAAAGEETARRIRGAGGDALFVRADVSEPGEVGAMVRVAVERFARIDILYNNAGIDLPQATSVTATSVADWDRTLAVNLKSVFLCCHQVIPLMLAQGGGVILNTASVAGLAPMAQEAAYGAAKGALLLLSRQMARDYARHNIRVNSISPGPMEKATRDRLAYLRQDPAALARRQDLVRRMPLGRLCLPEDIAQAALFLASDAATMITGANLVVDGGFLLDAGQDSS